MRRACRKRAPELNNEQSETGRVTAASRAPLDIQRLLGGVYILIHGTPEIAGFGGARSRGHYRPAKTDSMENRIGNVRAPRRGRARERVPTEVAAEPSGHRRRRL